MVVFASNMKVTPIIYLQLGVRLKAILSHTDDLFSSYRERAKLSYCSIFLGLNALNLLKLLLFFAVLGLWVEA